MSVNLGSQGDVAVFVFLHILHIVFSYIFTYVFAPRARTRKNDEKSLFSQIALLSRRSNLKILSKSRFSRRTKKTQNFFLYNCTHRKNREISCFFLEGEFSPSSRSERRNFSILAVFFFIFFQFLGLPVERKSY